MAALNLALPSEVKKQVFDKNPFVELERKSDKYRRAHPKTWKQEPKKWVEGNEVQQCADWLRLVKDKHPDCFDVQNKTCKNGCNCLSSVDVDKVANYTVDFLHEEKKARQATTKAMPKDS